MNRYGSSMGLVSNRPKPENMEGLPAQSPVRPEVDDPKDKSKKSLHEQYGELQQQFGKWQMQLMQNQQLLAKQKIVPEEQGKPLENIGTSAPMPPQTQEALRKVEVIRRESTSFVTSAAKREERLSSSSSQSSGYGGLAGRFSPDQLLSQKGHLKSNGNDDQSNSLRFNGDGSSSRISRQVSAPVQTVPREGSPPRKATLTHTMSASDALPPPPPPPPPMPQLNNPSPPPPPATDIETQGPVKSWGKKVHTKRPVPKFEPQLSPREELMLAIRNAGGRGALKPG